MLVFIKLLTILFVPYLFVQRRAKYMKIVSVWSKESKLFDQNLKPRIVGQHFGRKLLIKY